ncbi:hypothetical protein [Haloarchaeobius sp. DFWS5]|uniref:hypothetical protein n=1 Tax=Haloarchaeobius sp. DFWS5 TaxID=3446114 RepID=UPI003EC0ED9D
MVSHSTTEDLDLDPPDYPKICLVNRDRPELCLSAEVTDDTGELVASYEGRLYPYRSVTLAWVPPDQRYRISVEYDDEHHEAEWNPEERSDGTHDTLFVQVIDGEFTSNGIRFK